MSIVNNQFEKGDSMKKHLICFALVLLLLAASLPFCFITAHADGKYAIPSVDFYVEIQPDGSANIHEMWTVDYNGSFHRFRHGYLIRQPKAQKFDSLDISGFKINGESVPMSSDESDMTGNVIEVNGERQLCWYKTINGMESVTYEADYVLKNVVKSLDGKPVFSCRFVGQDFEKEISSVNVYLKKNSALSINDAYVNTNGGQAIVDGDYIRVGTTGSNGLFVATFIFSETTGSSYFTRTPDKISESDLEKAMKEVGSFTKNPFAALIGYGFPVLWFALTVVVSVVSRKNRKNGGTGYGCSSSSFSCGGGCGGGGCGGGGAD